MPACVPFDQHGIVTHVGRALFVNGQACPHPKGWGLVYPNGVPPTYAHTL